MFLVMSTRITPILQSLHRLKLNECIEYKLLSLIYKVLTPVNLAIFTTLCPFNPLALPVPHLLLCFPTHQPSPHWKSQITHLDMRHLVFRINFQIHFINLVSPVLIRLLSPHSLVNSSFSSSPCSGSTTTSLFHSRLKTYLFNKLFPP